MFRDTPLEVIVVTAKSSRKLNADAKALRRLRWPALARLKEAGLPRPSRRPT